MISYNCYLLGLSIAATISLFNLGLIIVLVGYLRTDHVGSLMGCNVTDTTLQLKIEDKGSLKQEVTMEKDDGTFLCSIILSICIMMTVITGLLMLWITKHRPILKFTILSASCFALFSCIMRNLASVTLSPYFCISRNDQVEILTFATLELCFEVLLIWIITTLRIEGIPNTDPNRVVIEIGGKAYNYVKQSVVKQIQFTDNNLNQKS